MNKATRIPIAPFASAERVPIEIIHRQAAEWAEAPLESELLNSLLNYVFVLNQQGQIVFASPNVPDLIRDKTGEEMLGLRPGEALSCIHAHEGPRGCGTSKACPRCGAVQAIVSSLAGKTALRKYRVTRVIGCKKEALNLLAMATPLVRNNETFSLLALTDSTNSDARAALERFFQRFNT